jgi:DNA polymerase III subunit gamma/tau
MHANASLYRKYRPGSFAQVLSQGHIVPVLENEIKNGKVAHAYLFSGSRGIGKTSVARIFAKTLRVNDEDVYEIDAASNRGIDDIRAIRESVHTLPYSSKYKIYIVDEVHMLTKEAFNALLKTLEEPPEHVIFILATTEPQKLPETVISRCETYQFKKPTLEALTNAILEIAKEEKYKLEKSSAALISVLADGSFRDAISTLQKIISSSSGEKLSEEDVERILGAPKHDFVLGIIGGISKGESETALDFVNKAVSANADMEVFLKMILRALRFVLLLRFSKDMESSIRDETGEQEFEKLKEIAKTANKINSKTLINFLDAAGYQSYSSIPSLPIELAIIKSCESAESTLL